MKRLKLYMYVSREDYCRQRSVRKPDFVVVVVFCFVLSLGGLPVLFCETEERSHGVCELLFVCLFVFSFFLSFFHQFSSTANTKLTQCIFETDVTLHLVQNIANMTVWHQHERCKPVYHYQTNMKHMEVDILLSACSWALLINTDFRQCCVAVVLLS